MTADEVLEVMKKAFANTTQCSLRQAPNCDGVCLCLRATRAAIRALPAGWVVAQVPGFILTEECDATEYHDAAGWNRALAAVRASAVGVDHIAEVSKMVIAESPHGQ